FICLVSHGRNSPPPWRDRARQAGFQGHDGRALMPPRNRMCAKCKSSLPGLTGQSIHLRKKLLRRRWMRGSSPRMTTCAMLGKNLMLGSRQVLTEETMMKKLHRRSVTRAVVALATTIAAAALAAAPVRAADPI